MKELPEEHRVVERMAPGILCREGFLGSDRRSLQDILDADRSAVQAAGSSHAQVAQRLEEILHDTIAALGRPVQISSHLTATWHEGMGKIPCPWADGMFHKGQMELSDRRTARRVFVTPLSIHLIAGHGFYQGRGGRYRIEPDEIVRMLDLNR